MDLSIYRNNLESKNKGKNNNEIVLRKIRFIVPAQNASISPPLGPILGQSGININDFCKRFNDKSKIFDSDILLVVNIDLYKNKTFFFSIKTPLISFLINEDNLILNDSSLIPYYVRLSSLYKILNIKRFDLNYNENSILYSVSGTIKTMHLIICNDLDE